MEFKWLEDFLSVAKLRNFSQAARERHATQPALSRRVKALEAWYGVPLVDRSTYPVVLTPAGDHFLPLAVTYDGKGLAEEHGFQAHVGPLRSKSRRTHRRSCLKCRRTHRRSCSKCRRTHCRSCSKRRRSDHRSISATRC